VNNPKIFTGKPSRYGDIICFIPFITYLKKIYPESYVTFFIDKTCAPVTQFLLNYPGIDRFQISLEEDKVIPKDIDKNYDLIFNLYNNLTNPSYYNYHNVQKENFIMSEIYTKDGLVKIEPKEYDLLTNQEKLPILNQYFKTERSQKTIAIWPFSGYGDSETTRKRSPSAEWWAVLTDALLLKGYKLLEFGHPNNKSLTEKASKIQDLRHMSLFDSIKISLGCDLVITTDSGVSHIFGAYGMNQICLYSPYQQNHFQNFEAMTPVNYKNNLTLFCGHDNINSINQEEIINIIK
jgi:ADP-heptose:LPS heptosyltransferase